MSEPSSPLDPLTSIRTKLGLLVAASVSVAALLTAIGSAGGVPPLLTLPVAVALALAVTQLLAAGMTQPLRQMTALARRMAGGDYSGRVEVRSSDEVGQLAAAFTSMAEDLAAVDRERRDLLATVSHELRTPLTAITAQLENLADGVVPPDAAHLGAALEQAERLRDLVADLLDLSRVEVGLVPLDTGPVGLAALVEACVAEVRDAGREAAYDVTVPADLVVRADSGRLRQLLVNVVDNAARHAPAGTPVRISAGERPGGWWLEVTDLGPGVAPADRERVFDRFGTDPDGGGTGVGLAVARWVAQLHGGTLRFLDPGGGAPGARLRLELPTRPPQPADVRPGPATRPATTDPEDPMTDLTASPETNPGPGPGSPDEARPGSAGFAVLSRVWPEPERSANPRVVLAAAAVGLLAGATMAFSLPGLAWTLVLLSAGAVALTFARHRRDPFTLGCAALAALLVLPLMLLDALWIGTLCVLAAAAVFLVGLTRARGVPGFLLTALAWPAAGLRGLPWLGRSVRLTGSASRAPAVVRTVAWSALGLVIFGLLFASADALFASWIGALVPDLSAGDLVLRGFVAVAVFGLTLAGAYVALAPPSVQVSAGRPDARLRNRFEWLVPVLVVDAVFVGFLLAQAAAVFGGHEYLERTTGITYADYVHQGFGQLTVATALTLIVVAAAARYAGRSREDLRWLRVSTGLLCALTLVVVASALYRMHVYQQAYGFTALRLAVDVFEAWLGLLVLAVMLAGLAGLGRWLPRFGLLSGAVTLLALAAINPDAWVASANIDRFEETGGLDVAYLESLSADAAPVIAERLPELEAACALRYLPLHHLSQENRDDVWAWNLGRERAEDALAGVDLRAVTPDAPQDPCGPVYAADRRG